ncbi:outer membrane protein [Ancylobacter sp. TS-1]|uniref:outer membrane protein n=1 Tax=Ancylobacter sp. TS-1 TaxID=1850374 RepID=UPI001265C3EE|nr:outer membrane beta-barrel protein [Ancylobacter sp. TS-1]QFR32892.1 outer membrane beta-barrel protein [Ancylobacter sp. TS-1]
MKSTILAGVSLAALLAVPAAAADLAYKAPAAYAPPPMAFTWTGFYIGANAGYGWGTADWSPDIDGFIGGLQAGYNWQGAGPLVLGVETDIQYADVSSGIFSLDYFGTVRARIGYAFDQVLVYGTGGLAYGGGTYETWGLSNSKNQIGWTLGGGAEYAINNNWSVKGEYLYVDLGEESYQTLTGPRDVGVSSNILRAGVNYRF